MKNPSVFFEGMESDVTTPEIDTNIRTTTDITPTSSRGLPPSTDLRDDTIENDIRTLQLDVTQSAREHVIIMTSQLSVMRTAENDDATLTDYFDDVTDLIPCTPSGKQKRERVNMKLEVTDGNMPPPPMAAPLSTVTHYSPALFIVLCVRLTRSRLFLLTEVFYHWTHSPLIGTICRWLSDPLILLVFFILGWRLIYTVNIGFKQMIVLFCVDWRAFSAPCPQNEGRGSCSPPICVPFRRTFR